VKIKVKVKVNNGTTTNRHTTKLTKHIIGSNKEINNKSKASTHDDNNNKETEH